MNVEANVFVLSDLKSFALPTELHLGPTFSSTGEFVEHIWLINKPREMKLIIHPLLVAFNAI